MSTVKRWIKYIIWIILFWFFSDILITVGINSTYKDMDRRATIPYGIEVVQMQSTKVNGRIKLKLSNKELSGKALKIDLYSKSGNQLGTQYLEIGNVNENETKELETYFKISDVKSYEISVVDEMGKSTEGFMDTALSAMTIFVIIIKLAFV